MPWPPTTHQHVQDRVGPGVPVRVGDVSGLWYTSAGASTPTAATLAQLYLMPLWVPDGTINELAIRVSTAGASGALVRIGLYGETNGVPSSLILDAGTVSAETTGVKQVVVSQAVTAGRVWAAVVTQGVTSSLPNLSSADAGVGFSALGTTAPHVGYIKTSITGALPNPVTALTASSSVLRLFYKMAA